MSARPGNGIKQRIWLSALVVVAVLVVAPRVSAQTLTNADVVKMVQAKLSDALIISEIKHSTCNFDTSPNALIKLKQAGVSDKVLQAMTEAGHTPSPVGAASSPSLPSPGQPSTPMGTPATIATAGCSNFSVCMHAGGMAMGSRRWAEALVDFKRASTMDAARPGAWAAQGFARLPLGQGAAVPTAWDNALRRRGTLALRVWHYAGFHFQGGIFRLNSRAITFANSKRKTVFSVPPSQVFALKSHHPPLGGRSWSFGMKIQGHQYWFSFVPIGVQCRNPITCNNPAGYAQEGVVSNYVAQTIPKLASGALTAAAPLPPSEPSAPATTQTSASGEKSEDLVYIPSYEGIGLLEFQPGHPFFRHVAKTTGTNDFLIVYNRQRNEFYVGQENGNEIPIISGDSFAQSGSLTDSVGWNTSDLILSHNCSRLAAAGSGGKVLVFDTSSRTLIRKFFVPTRSYPTYVAFSPDDRWLYVSSGNYVFVYDSTNFQLIRQKSFTGWSASPLAISPDGTALFLLQNSAVVRLSTSSLDVVSSVRLPEATIASYHSHLQISRDGSAVWVAGKKAIYRVSLVSGGLTLVRPPGIPTDREYQFAQSSDGKNLYVLSGTSASAELLTLDVKMGVTGLSSFFCRV